MLKWFLFKVWFHTRVHNVRGLMVFKHAKSLVTYFVFFIDLKKKKKWLECSLIWYLILLWHFFPTTFLFQIDFFYILLSCHSTFRIICVRFILQLGVSVILCTVNICHEMHSKCLVYCKSGNFRAYFIFRVSSELFTWL